jgi:arabinose-5-phosphate isomerase
MMNIDEIIEYGKNIIQKEEEALLKLRESINHNFFEIIDLLINCKGKIVLTGIGKSGIICQKISATLSSTGTPSFFLHPSEALHGDVGSVDKNDIVIAVSVSGESEELLMIIPTLKLLSNKIIGITTKRDSNLAKNVDAIFIIPEIEEACHLNLAPSSSSTAILAFGDALSLTLSKLRDFKYEDFAIRHPGGLIGKKLTLKIKDLMHTGEEIPVVNENDNINKVILEMSSKRLGTTGVLCNGNFVGIITDGDLRRAIEKHKNIFNLKAKDIMSYNPKTINEDERALNGLVLMEKYAITVLFVKNRLNEIIGVIHLHDILRSGLRL